MTVKTSMAPPAKSRRTRLLLLLAGILLIPLGFGFWRAADRAEQRAQKQNCLSKMVSINLAGRMWSGDHGDHMPRTFTEMSNECSSPKLLFCHADTNAQHKQMSSWATFDEKRSSYEIVNPGISETNPNSVFARCTVHGHLGYVDGSVFDGQRRLRPQEAKSGSLR
jgi:hypothetical protein